MCVRSSLLPVTLVLVAFGASACGPSPAELEALARQQLESQGYSAIQLRPSGADGRFEFEARGDEPGETCSGRISVSSSAGATDSRVSASCSSRPNRAAPTPSAPAQAAEQKVGDAALSKRLAAFSLGKWLVTAVYARSQGDAENEAHHLRKATARAAELGVDVPPLPAMAGSKAEKDAAALHYLLKGTDALEAAIGATTGPQTKAGFKLALALGLLVKLWGAEEAKSVLAGVMSQTRRAGIPEALLEPLLTRVAEHPADLSDAIIAYFKRVESYLAGAADEARAAAP
jgi:hypothetical protein